MHGPPYLLHCMAKKGKGNAEDSDAKQKKAEEMRLWRTEMREVRKRKKMELRVEGSNKTKDSGRKPKPLEDELPEGNAPRKQTHANQGLIKEEPARARKSKPIAKPHAEEGDRPNKKMKQQECNEHSGQAESTDPEAFKVVVAGLPLAISEERLREDFSECGEVLNVRLLRDRNTKDSRGIAFISFTNQAALDEALKFNGDDYGGRSLLVELAKKDKASSRDSSQGKGTGKGKGKSNGPGEKPVGCTSVVVKGLAYVVIEADLKKLFAVCGDGPTNINLLTDRESGESRGVAFVDFDSETAVDEAIKLDGSELKGRRFSMDYAIPRESGRGKAASKEPGKKPKGCTSVVVKGLAYASTVSDVMKVFESCGGGPNNVRIATDNQTGASRGIAFVDFDSESAVDEAIKLHGTEFMGRRFIMDYAAPLVKEDSEEKDNGKEAHKGPGTKPVGCTSVVLRCLADKVTEKLLMKTFKSCGEGPRNANIVLDKGTGESTGTAFVNFASEAAVDEAIKLDGTELKGQRFTMGYVKPKPREKR